MINCPLCTKVFKSPADLDLHVFSHTKEKPHKCQMCPAAFGNKYVLAKHIKCVHEGMKQIKRSYECPSEGCNYKAKTRATLGRHLKTHSNEKPFSCKYPGCSYTGRTNYYLMAHNSRAHSNDRPFKCLRCDFRAKRKTDLARHQFTHEKVRRFKCQVPKCSFATHLKEKLKPHFDRKHRKKTVLCTEPGCNFRYGSNTLLKEHLKCHKPMLKCPHDSCNFTTRLKTVLRSHISSRHEDFSSNGKGAQQRKHVCTFCLSRFTDFTGLQDHIQRHTGEKPHRCSCCEYTTAFTGRLKEHARKAHRIRVICRSTADEMRSCRTCCMKFWSGSELVLHSLSHLQQPIVVLQQLKLEVL